MLFYINQILTLKPYFAYSWKPIPWEKNNKWQNKTENLALSSSSWGYNIWKSALPFIHTQCQNQEQMGTIISHESKILKDT